MDNNIICVEWSNEGLSYSNSYVIKKNDNNTYGILADFPRKVQKLESLESLLSYILNDVATISYRKGLENGRKELQKEYRELLGVGTDE